MKRKYTGDPKRGRPRLRPNLRWIARKLADTSPSFDQKGWVFHDSKDNFVLSGKYILTKEVTQLDKPDELIPFNIYLPRFCSLPHRKLRLLFPQTNHLRYITAKYGLREHILGILNEKIETMAAQILKTDFTQEEVLPKSRTFTLKEMYKHCDCTTIDIIPLLNEKGEPIDQFIVIDDEGKYREPLIANVPATLLWWKGRMSLEEYRKHSTLLDLKGSVYINEMMGKLDYIAGQVLLCDSHQID